MGPHGMEVLDQCVADVRAGLKSIDECLADHPDEGDVLEALLPVALAIVPSDVVPDPSRKLQARYRFVEALHRQSSRGQAIGWGWLGRLAPLPRQAAAALAALVVTAACGGAAVFATQDAQPDDLLYGLKTAIEEQQVAVARSPEDRAQTRLSIAARRLKEVERALDAGKQDVAAVAATAYSETVDRALQDIDQAQNAGRSVDDVISDLERSQARQRALAATAAEEGATAAGAALQSSSEGVARDRGRARPGAAPPTVSASSGPSSGAGPVATPGRAVARTTAEPPRPTPTRTAAEIASGTEDEPWEERGRDTSGQDADQNRSGSQQRDEREEPARRPTPDVRGAAARTPGENGATRRTDGPPDDGGRGRRDSDDDGERGRRDSNDDIDTIGRAQPTSTPGRPDDPGRNLGTGQPTPSRQDRSESSDDRDGRDADTRSDDPSRGSRPTATATPTARATAIIPGQDRRGRDVDTDDDSESEETNRGGRQPVAPTRTPTPTGTLTATPTPRIPDQDRRGEREAPRVETPGRSSGSDRPDQRSGDDDEDRSNVRR